jgi:hypothetical protein
LGFLNIFPFSRKQRQPPVPGRDPDAGLFYTTGGFMGDMADLAYEQMMRAQWEPEDQDEEEDAVDTYHPIIWTRANGAKIHIKDMNNHHLGNAIRHLEKAREGYKEPMPAIYFNMLKLAHERGLGVSSDQISLLLARATARKPLSMAIYNENRSSLTNGQYDLLLSLEDDGEAITLVVVDSGGDQKFPLAAIRRSGKMVYMNPPEDGGLDVWENQEVAGE